MKVTDKSSPLNVFIGAFEIEIDEETDQEVCELIARKVASFVFCERLRLENTDDCFLLYKEDDSFNSISIGFYDDETDIYNDLIHQIEDTGYQKFISTHDTVAVAFIIHGRNHWDYDFLKLSAVFEEHLIIFGPHPEYSEIVTQEYIEGEYDEGIQQYPDSCDYIGEEGGLGYTNYDLTNELFDISYYETE